jgi:hypothetical protein
MSTRHELEAVLEKAEAELVRQAAVAAAADRDRDLSLARLDKVRAYCRRMRTAVDGAPAPDSEKACPYPPVAQAAGEDIPRPRNAAAIPPAAPAAPPDRPWLLRQTVGLTALLLAYLMYFHLDVKLQIMRLPVLVLEWLLK